jgi:hypothetical protein
VLRKEASSPGRSCNADAEHIVRESRQANNMSGWQICRWDRLTGIIRRQSRAVSSVTTSVTNTIIIVSATLLDILFFRNLILYSILTFLYWFNLHYCKMSRCPVVLCHCFSSWGHSQWEMSYEHEFDSQQLQSNMQHDYTCTYGMMEHDHNSVNTWWSTWMNSSLTEGFVLVVCRIGYCGHQTLVSFNECKVH